jgi:SAM-dependent methyltransferase
VAASEQPNAVEGYFAETFLARTLREQVQDVPRYYLFERIAQIAAEHQPMLEAGCGAGQWVAWASERGYDAIGVDWSAELISRAAAEYPRARFVVGDLRELPLEDDSVGSIIALGSVEHTIEGPEASLAEFARVLRPGGPALVTVPFLGPVRSAVWRLVDPLRHSPRLRRALGRSGGLKPLRIAVREDWRAAFLATDDGWSFYEYQFNRATMRRLLTNAGLALEEEFLFAPEEGLVQTFHRLAGRYGEHGAVLGPGGRLLRRVLPAGTYEHMLGYLARKPQSP